MLVELLRKNRPGGLLALPVVVALLWPGVAPEAWAPTDVPRGMPLFVLVQDQVGAGWGSVLLGGLLVCGVGALLAALSNGVGLTGTHNYLPALVLPVVLAQWPGGLHATPALMGMPFVLLAMWRSWAMPVRSSALMSLFDAGLLVGLAGCFHLPYFFVIVPIWAGLSVMRPVHWREYLLPLIGMFMVLFLVWGAFHLWPVLPWDPLGSMVTPPHIPWEMHWMHRVVLIAWVVLCGALALWWTAREYGRSVMLGKNIRAAFFALSLTLVLMAAFEVFLLGNRTPAVLLAMPCAVLYGYALLPGRAGGWGSAGFWGLFILALWGRWLG